MGQSGPVTCCARHVRPRDQLRSCVHWRPNAIGPVECEPTEFTPKNFFGWHLKKHMLLFTNSHLKPMEQSMSDCNVPLGTSNIQTSMLHVDDLLRNHEVRSGWK